MVVNLKICCALGDVRIQHQHCAFWGIEPVRAAADSAQANDTNSPYSRSVLRRRYRAWPTTTTRRRRASEGGPGRCCYTGAAPKAVPQKHIKTRARAQVRACGFWFTPERGGNRTLPARLGVAGGAFCVPGVAVWWCGSRAMMVNCTTNTPTNLKTTTREGPGQRDPERRTRPKPAKPSQPRLNPAKPS